MLRPHPAYDCVTDAAATPWYVRVNHGVDYVTTVTAGAVSLGQRESGIRDNCVTDAAVGRPHD